ncbi:MAG: helix-turn-helix domain-containing protein [Bacteroidales bacterium]|nr:helix-turn-helix domain-containing protein [Bacteroidales bacterium]
MDINNKAIKEEILREMERQGITAYQLADEIGVRRQTLYSYLNDATEGTNSVTLAKILHRLGFRVLSPGDLANVKTLL